MPSHNAEPGSHVTPTPANTIRVSAVVMQDHNGLVLNVRKRGTDRFMLPGGKPEQGETAADAAIREFFEELGAQLDPALLQPLGEFEAAAANEAGHTVVADVFTHPYIEGAKAHAEIDEVVWVDPAAHRDDLAPLTTGAILPRLLGNSPTP